MLAHSMLLTYIRTKLPFSNRQRLRKSPGHPASRSAPVTSCGLARTSGIRQPRSCNRPCVNPPGYSFTACAAPDSTPWLLGPRNLEPSVQPLATPHISGSYRLRRHFPRYCDVSTRVTHPYLPRFLPRDTLSAGSSPSGRRNFIQNCRFSEDWQALPHPSSSPAAATSLPS